MRIINFDPKDVTTLEEIVAPFKEQAEHYRAELDRLKYRIDKLLQIADVGLLNVSSDQLRSILGVDVSVKSDRVYDSLIRLISDIALYAPPNTDLSRRVREILEHHK